MLHLMKEGRRVTTSQKMYRFTKIWHVNGSNIYPGVSLRGEFEVKEDTISVKGSKVFVDIPKEYLEPYELPLPINKKKKS